MISLSWKHGGENAWNLYHGLTPEGRRPWDPDGPPVRPRFPMRWRSFVLALGYEAERQVHERAKAAARSGM